jgi:hypothetical protein
MLQKLVPSLQITSKTHTLTIATMANPNQVIPTLTPAEVADLTNAMASSPSCKAQRSTTGPSSTSSTPTEKLPAPALPGKHQSKKQLLFEQIEAIYEEPYLEADVRRNKRKMGGFASWENFWNRFQNSDFFAVFPRCTGLKFWIIQRFPAIFSGPKKISKRGFFCSVLEF